jgi:putative sterol carrier protein
MSSTAEFFDELGRRGHEPLLRRVSAVIGFEIADGPRTQHRLVSIDSGNLRIRADDARADATFTCSRAEFDDLVCGRTNTMASLLRGALTVAGDPELLVLAQRLFSCMPIEESGPSAAAAGDRHE